MRRRRTPRSNRPGFGTSSRFAQKVATLRLRLANWPGSYIKAPWTTTSRIAPCPYSKLQKPCKCSVSGAAVIPSSACSRFCPPSVPCFRSGCAAAPRWSSNSSPCDIATSVARPEPFTATEPMQPSRRRASSRSAIASLRCTRAQSPRRETWSQGSGALVHYRISSSATFIGTPISWPDGLLRDRRLLIIPRSADRGSGS